MLSGASQDEGDEIKHSSEVRFVDPHNWAPLDAKANILSPADSLVPANSGGSVMLDMLDTTDCSTTGPRNETSGQRVAPRGLAIDSGVNHRRLEL